MHLDLHSERRARRAAGLPLLTGSLFWPCSHHGRPRSTFTFFPAWLPRAALDLPFDPLVEESRP